MIKRLVIAVVLLTLIVGGVVGFNLFRSKMIAEFFAGATPPPVSVSTSVAEAIAWAPSLEAIGTANAAQGVDLAVEAGGTVKEIFFTSNQKVLAGEKLMQISEREQRADLAAAEAAFALATTELERARALQARGVSASNNVEVAQAEATSARAQVAKLTAILEQKELSAPFAGVIGIPQVEEGQYVTVGDIYATLQNLESMRVDFALPEQQISVIRPGLPISVSTEVGDYQATGKITGIEPKVDPNSRLVTIRAEVENETGILYPGQFLRVKVELPTEDGVIAVPQTAVTTSLYGDSVFALRPGDQPDTQKVEQVFVTVGRRSGQMMEIVKGLKAGDEVVNAGQNRLAGGATVVVDNTVAPVPPVTE